MLFFIFARRRGFLRRLIYRLCLFDEVFFPPLFSRKKGKEGLLFTLSSSFSFPFPLNRWKGKKKSKANSIVPLFPLLLYLPLPPPSVLLPLLLLLPTKEKKIKTKTTKHNHKKKNKKNKQKKILILKWGTFITGTLLREVCVPYCGFGVNITRFSFSLSVSRFLFFFSSFFLFVFRRVIQKTIYLFNIRQGFLLMSGLTHTWKCLLLVMRKNPKKQFFPFPLFLPSLSLRFRMIAPPSKFKLLSKKSNTPMAEDRMGVY